MKETCTCSFDIKQNIREIKINNIKIGGDTFFNFMKENGNTSSPIYVLEINIFNPEKSFYITKDVFGKFFNDKVELIKQIQNTECDILGLKFNIETINQVEEAKILLKTLLPHIQKPLMIRGCNDFVIDRVLIPELLVVLDREVIISCVNEYNYKEIIPCAIKGNHVVAIRTAIDLNHVKEMNLIVTQMGLSSDKILIDTDMGGLGYGLEYGYSMMEKVKLTGFRGDNTLNMPIISFCGEESLKTKEAICEDLDKNYGDFKQRALMIEIASASAVVSAGANVVVLNHPDSIRTMKGLK